MYYEINVAKKRPTIYGVDGGYSHFFATAERSCQTKQQVTEVVKEFIEKFPEPEYQISVTHHPEVGKFIDVEKLLEDKE